MALPTYEETVASEDPLVAVPKRSDPPPPYSPAAPPPAPAAPAPAAPPPAPTTPVTTGPDPASVRPGVLQDVFEAIGPPPEPNHDETRLQRYHRVTRFDREEMDSLEFWLESMPDHVMHCASPVFDLWTEMNPDLRRKVEERRVRFNNKKNDRLYVVIQDLVSYYQIKDEIVQMTRDSEWSVNWLLVSL